MYPDTKASPHIRGVYLSDLHLIKSIFSNVDTELKEPKPHDSDPVKQFSSTNLGLPLAIIEMNKAIVGYAAVKINANEDSEIYSLMAATDTDNSARQQLQDYALTTLNALKKDNQNVEAHIRVFVAWLNKCV